MHYTRRCFLGHATASAAVLACPTIVPANALGRGGKLSPSERVVTGCIGLGFGWRMLAEGPEVQCVALCDVQRNRLRAAQGEVGNGCIAYHDFRDLLLRDDIDAVYVATPDHWHALVTVAAARAGKDVYCQKPLTRTIAEGQAVVEAVNRYGIVFQHGTQHRHEPRTLFGRELVRNGYIGELKRVKIGSSSGRGGGATTPQPVPPDLDWDMWVGPAPWAPFREERIRPHDWYFMSDYCLGYIAGLGVHHVDDAQHGSGLDDVEGAVEVEARGTFEPGLFDNPYEWDIRYQFPNGVQWHYTDTGSSSWNAQPPTTEDAAEWRGPKYPYGTLFEGSEGWVYIWRGRLVAQPKSLLNVKISPNDPVQLVRPGGDPIPSFIDCVRRRQRRTCAPVEVAHRATNLCSLGAIGMILNRPLRWDAAREEFPGDDQANRLRSRAMREPWHFR